MKTTKFSSLLTALVFVTIVLGGFVLCLLVPDKEASVAERRKLEQFPTVRAQTVVSGEFFTDFEQYATDQLPLRDYFRRLKAFSRFSLLGRLENNGIAVYDGSAVKLTTHYNATLLSDNVALWGTVAQNYFPNAKLCYALIPDKNYFLSGYPHLDYDALRGQIAQTAPQNATALDLFDKLSLSDYYATDLHWKHESIYPIAAYLSEALGTRIDAQSAYTAADLGEFYGVYVGQSALPLAPDRLYIRTSDVIDQARTYVYRARGSKIERIEGAVYAVDTVSEDDRYSVYLMGSEAVVEVENPHARSGKTLAVFRDSFASALVPYLISGYERILLLDTRYLSSRMLGTLPLRLSEVDEILFLYSVTTLTQTAMR